MFFKKLLVVFMTFWVIGCYSSPYKYHVQPSPLTRGESSYYLKNVNVNLTLGHGAIPGDTAFSTEKEMVKQFTNSISLALKDKGILASNPSEADANLEITIDYKRKFNYGGKALNKPEVSHFVNIYKNDKKLVSFSHSSYTTQYSYLEDIAVSLEIGAFMWGADDELKDIDLMSKSIVEDVYKIGK